VGAIMQQLRAGKTLAFIGDSVTRQMAFAFECAAHRSAARGEDPDSGGDFISKYSKKKAERATSPDTGQHIPHAASDIQWVDFWDFGYTSAAPAKNEEEEDKEPKDGTNNSVIYYKQDQPNWAVSAVAATAPPQFHVNPAQILEGGARGLPLRKGRLAARPPLLDLNSSRPLWTDLNPDSSLDF
jgi:hypothetical protein